MPSTLLTGANSFVAAHIINALIAAGHHVPTDLLTRHKSSLPVDIKSPPGHSLILSLVQHADILIDPFRPGVLEKLGRG